MEELPYREVIVETPVGTQTKGKAIDVEVYFSALSQYPSSNLTGFNVHRAYVACPSFVRECPATLPKWFVLSNRKISGGPLEQGLQRVISDVPIGSLLVQSDSKTGEPLLFHAKLPNCIRERHRAVNAWVFLLDAQACLFFHFPWP